MLNNFPRLYTATNPTKVESKPDYSLFIWNKSRKLPHPYLYEKHITLGNARVSVYQDLNRIIVPLTDSIPENESELDIKTLHCIHADGSFRNKKLKGLFHIASAYDCCKDFVMIAEGFAAARSISEAMPAVYVVACIAACNILTVALRIRELLPDSKIVMAGSNNGASEREGEKAIQALGGNCQVIYPTLEFSDFNGMFIAAGKDNLNKYIQGVSNVEKEIIYAQR